MTKRVSLRALLGAFALLACALPVPAQAEDEMMDTLAGCLNPGEGDGWFVLTTDDGDVSVKGGEGIAAHAGNHQVELTGKWVEGEDGEKYFDASGVEHKGICE